MSFKVQYGLFGTENVISLSSCFVPQSEKFAFIEVQIENIRAYLLTDNGFPR